MIKQLLVHMHSTSTSDRNTTEEEFFAIMSPDCGVAFLVLVSTVLLKSETRSVCFFASICTVLYCEWEQVMIKQLLVHMHNI